MNSRLFLQIFSPQKREIALQTELLIYLQIDCTETIRSKTRRKPNDIVITSSLCSNIIYRIFNVLLPKWQINSFSLFPVLFACRINRRPPKYKTWLVQHVRDPPDVRVRVLSGVRVKVPVQVVNPNQWILLAQSLKHLNPQIPPWFNPLRRWLLVANVLVPPETCPGQGFGRSWW